MGDSPGSLLQPRCPSPTHSPLRLRPPPVQQAQHPTEGEDAAGHDAHHCRKGHGRLGHTGPELCGRQGAGELGDLNHCPAATCQPPLDLGPSGWRAQRQVPGAKPRSEMDAGGPSWMGTGSGQQHPCPSPSRTPSRQRRGQAWPPASWRGFWSCAVQDSGRMPPVTTQQLQGKICCECKMRTGRQRLTEKNERKIPR